MRPPLCACAGLAMPRRTMAGCCRRLVALLLVALALATGAHAQKSLVGVYKLEPGLTHPMVMDALVDAWREMEGLELGLHKSVPFSVKLARGKRMDEYSIECDPPVNITRLILPGLVNAKLQYEGRRYRPVRFEISSRRGSLYVTSYCSSVGRVGGFEIAFVDLDHDGALGTIHDGYVVKTPKQKQWTYGEGSIDLRQTTQPLEFEGVKYWFEVDWPGFQLIVSNKEPDFSVQRAEDARVGLEYLNELRKTLGHAPIDIDWQLSSPCEQHALYCATNGELTHDQDQGKPGYSKAGAVAGKNSELCYAKTMREGIKSFEGTFYHRLYMLSPSVKRVGMGLVHGVVVLDTKTHHASGSFEPFAWPPDGAAELHPSWTSGEHPSPVGGAEFDSTLASRYGYPISLTFPTAAVTKVEARLTAGGRELDVFVSTPENPGNRELPDNLSSILVMSKAPLPWDSEVRVEVRCQHAGKPYEKTWVFRTRKR
jgi:hypothetical protein